MKKSDISEEETEELTELLSGLGTEELINIFGEDFRENTKKFVRWEWKFCRPIKKHIFQDYIKERSNFDNIKILNESKNSNNTLKFIEDIRKEIQKFPEELAKIFPERIKKYSYREFSSFWMGKENFIKNLKRRKKDYKISNRLLKILWKKLNDCFSDKSLNDIENLLNNYSMGSINRKEFLAELKTKIGKITRSIEVTDSELGILIARKDYYITDKVFYIKDKYPDYKFSLELLDYFENNIRKIFGLKAFKIYEIIQKYRESNTNLKRYSKQQFDVKRPDVFKVIDNPEKAYWFGFLHADGYIDTYRSDYNICLELSAKDRQQLKAFARFIGATSKDIKKRTRTLRYNDKIKKYKMIYIKKGIKPLVLDLISKDFFALKNYTKGIPDFVKKNINEVNNKPRWQFTDQGRIAFAWLLGLFDGDGTYYEKSRSGRLYSNNKLLLEEIKIYFEIDSEVLLNHEGQIINFNNIGSDKEGIISKPQFSLNLYAQIYQMMENSYSGGLKRKRPKKKDNNIL